jgi:hypothetical protein
MGATDPAAGSARPSARQKAAPRGQAAWPHACPEAAYTTDGDTQTTGTAPRSRCRPTRGNSYRRQTRRPQQAPGRRPQTTAL